jgi:hypothetical protein
LTPFSYFLPFGIAAVVMVARNSRPRKLRIERLWIRPAVLFVAFALVLITAPPPFSATAIALLLAGLAIGVALGWQRGRMTRIHIHLETHELSARASPLGLIFIFALLAFRYLFRMVLAENAALLGVPVFAAGDALFALGVAMIGAQQLEIWLRASRMLAQAETDSSSRVL